MSETKATMPAALPEEVPGIFITKETISNMEKERILVAGFAVVDILARTKLSIEAQDEAVDKLAARTPYLFQMEPTQIHEKIKVALTQETVIEYLRHEGIIRKEVDMVEAGIDEEGSVVVTAFYTKVSREIRRAIQKNMKPEDMERMEQAINLLDQDVNLVEAAAKKLEAMKNKPKVVPFKKRK